MSKAHWYLHSVQIQTGSDYSDDGLNRGADCSCGCRWYLPLEGKLGGDWGVCVNQASQRCGLLTFEHAGCKHFENIDARMDGNDDWLEMDSGDILDQALVGVDVDIPPG